MWLNRSMGRAFLMVLMTIGAAQVGHAREFRIGWSTVDGGGVMTSTGHGLEVSGTIGQYDAAGPLTAGRFSLVGGFWFSIGPGDCNWDGSLDLLDCNQLADCVTGPGIPPGPHCVCFDMDDDADVDLDDFSGVQEMFSR